MSNRLRRRRGLFTALQQGGAAPTIPWYLKGSVSAANCIGAYQAKGVASYAASKINLSTPGTYDLAEWSGFAVPWDTVNGWKGDGVKYLQTGIVPGDQWSMIVKFSVLTAGSFLCGSGKSGEGVILIWPTLGGWTIYENGDFDTYDLVVPASSEGVLAMAGSHNYRNGLPEPAGTNNGNGGNTNDIYILTANCAGNAVCTANVQAIAIYNTVITADQVAAITTAMNAL